MIRLYNQSLVPLVALFLVFAAQSPAKAIVLITHGDEISHVADVPSGTKEIVREQVGKNADVGFKYSHFGVFWLEIWTWSGEFCLYSGDEHWPLDNQQAAAILGVSEGDVARPWRYNFPPGLIAVIVIGALAGVRKYFAKSQTDKIKELLKDPRYQQAVAIIQDHVDKGHDETADGASADGSSANDEDDDGGFEEAVQYLVAQGIPHDEAVINLATVINVVFSHVNNAG